MGERLRVVQLVSSLEVGGLERLVTDLIVGVRSDSEVSMSIVVLNGQPSYRWTQQIDAHGGHKLFLGRNQGSRNPIYLIRFLRFVLNERPHVVHAHNAGAKYWAIFLKVVVPGVKIVFTVHDSHIVSRYSVLARAVHRVLIDATVSISRAVASECENAKIPKNETIYNGVEIDRFRVRSSKPFETYPVRIISVARIAPYKKGQDLLLRAVRMCIDRGLDVTCDFVGGVSDNEPGGQAYLESLVAELSLVDRVRFLGDRSDIPELLASGDLFVLASRFEGFGLVVVEAMAAGLPVVVSNIGGPAEIVEDGKSGLIAAAEDPAAIAYAIERIIRDPELCRQLSLGAVDRARAFDITYMRARYIALYERLSRGI